MSDSNVIQPAYLANVQVGKSLKQDVSTLRPGYAEKPTVTDLVGGINRGVLNEANEASAKQPKTVGQGSDQLDKVIEKLNGEFLKTQNYLRFEKDEDTEKTVVFIKNGETDEIIRQIPSQAFLNLSKDITRFLEMNQQQHAENKYPTGLITHETA